MFVFLYDLTIKQMK